MPAVVSVSTLTPERITALVAIGLALAGAIVGGLALARARRGVGGGGRRGASVALLLGASGLLLGAFVVANARGGLGAGKGFGGGVLAIVVGSSGTALSGLALLRSRPTG